MKIFNLTSNSKVYTSNAYLILGSWNALADVNTLIDVGRDVSVIERIKEINTGVAKKKVAQVVLTHSHFDHVGALKLIKKEYSPAVYAFSESLDGVDHILKDGDNLKIGDRNFEVIHTPGHSCDSICLYCEEDGAVFAGDTPLIINSCGGTYERPFVDALKKLSRRSIKVIYFGHGPPLLKNCNARLKSSLQNIKTLQD